MKVLNSSKNLLSAFALVLALAMSAACAPEEVVIDESASLLEKLEAIPGATVEKIEATEPFKEAYKVMIEQPLDHKNPDGPQFMQKVYVSHMAYGSPTVMETEGYALFRNRTMELGKLLKANQVQVEHRFFGDSVPEDKDYQYLMLEQAANDLHNIYTIFKDIYPTKWISSGISKGGQTSLVYKRFFPEDMDASLPYVAPLAKELEDKRCDEFIAAVGTPEVREQIIEFQRAVLSRKAEILPAMREIAAEKKYSFSIGEEVALEYAVAEYPFSFWQWGNVKPADIPAPDASAEELIKHLDSAVSLYYYNDSGLTYLEPHFWMAIREYGYYGYNTENIKDLVTAKPNLNNIDFAPDNPEYDPTVINSVHSFLAEKGNNIAYIYGELDTWTACAVEPAEATNAIKLVAAGGTHGTRIRHLSDEQKEELFSKLEEWLEVEIER